MSYSTALTELIGTSLTKEQVWDNLKKQPDTYHTFLQLPEPVQQEILDFCCGEKCINLCYNAVFKTIFDAYTKCPRLEKLLGTLLNQEVKILTIIPTEGTRLSDRGSFVIMDIVVQLADHSIINLEIQKLGYRAPAKRLDCYCADLIMREYTRLKAIHQKAFSYDMLSPVISIVLIENSPAMFHQFPDQYIHQIQMKSDTGIDLKNLPKQIYIPLDIFRKNVHNKPIETPLEAWLTLLSDTSLSRVAELIQKFPDFADIYREVFELRIHPKELMTMFSEILYEGDRNMERLMINDMMEELKTLKENVEAAKSELDQTASELTQKTAELTQKTAELAQKDTELEQKDTELTQKNAELAQKDTELEQIRQENASLQAQLAKEKKS